MRETPYDIFTPTDALDNEGGRTVTLLEKDRREIWGIVTYHEAETRIIVDEREDVKIGDIIIVEESLT